MTLPAALCAAFFLTGRRGQYLDRRRRRPRSLCSTGTRLAPGAGGTAKNPSCGRNPADAQSPCLRNGKRRVSAAGGHGRPLHRAGCETFAFLSGSRRQEGGADRKAMAAAGSAAFARRGAAPGAASWDAFMSRPDPKQLTFQ